MIPVGGPHPAWQTLFGERMASPRANKVQIESLNQMIADFDGIGRCPLVEYRRHVVSTVYCSYKLASSSPISSRNREGCFGQPE